MGAQKVFRKVLAFSSGGAFLSSSMRPRSRSSFSWNCLSAFIAVSLQGPGKSEGDSPRSRPGP
ncbi:hypothetical protein D7V93_21485 [Corallococcus llansteffanensis]|uniref:Uncharacterized protein n=1 Tax=Corallococcus llansteffanensis TaxID=2316731 RepID=A0A3A8PI02_9BACT|nr:hypothetical protein D7V93_21485 [Corallococcus llansteffanensis]